MKDVVDLATSESPPLRYSVDEIVQSGQRGQRRRRAGWAAAGGCALVAIGVAAAVAVPSILNGASRSSGDGAVAVGASTVAAQPVPATAPPFTFTFGAYQVGKLRVAQPVDVSTAYQIAPVYADGLAGTELYSFLTVYRPGAYDPSRLANAHPVTVAGQPGLEATGPARGSGVVRTLAWQYAPNAWAVIDARSSQDGSPAAADLRNLAAGLRGTAPSEARIPIQLHYVPAGYRLAEVGMHAMTGLNGIADVRNGDYAGLLFANPALPTTGLSEPYGGVDGEHPPGSFLIFVVPSQNSNQQASAGISCGHGFCNRWSTDGSVNVQVASDGRLSNSEMTKILNGITIGDVHNDGTWSTVSAAVS